jgi:hypothetical protein
MDKHFINFSSQYADLHNIPTPYSRRFTGDSLKPAPIKVYRSAWTIDPLTMGTYRNLLNPNQMEDDQCKDVL